MHFSLSEDRNNNSNGNSVGHEDRNNNTNNSDNDDDNQPPPANNSNDDDNQPIPAPSAQMLPLPASSSAAAATSDDDVIDNATADPASSFSAAISTQLDYIAHLLNEGRNFLIVPLDDDDNDDSDDEVKEEVIDPLDTEESHLTTEESVPDAAIGQIFVKTLSGKTLTVNNVTTKTNIIDIKNAIEEKDGLPVECQRLCYQNKKVKNNHTVGFYGIQKEHELHLMGRLRGGGKRAASRAEP